MLVPATGCGRTAPAELPPRRQAPPRRRRGRRRASIPAGAGSGPLRSEPGEGGSGAIPSVSRCRCWRYRNSGPPLAREAARAARSRRPREAPGSWRALTQLRGTASPGAGVGRWQGWGVLRTPYSPSSACSMRSSLPVTASSAAAGAGCCSGRPPTAPKPAAARGPRAARARSPPDEADTKPSNPK